MKYYIIKPEHRWITDSQEYRLVGTVITYNPETKLTVYYSRNKRCWDYFMSEPDLLVMLWEMGYIPATLEEIEAHLGYKLEEAVPLEPIKNI